MRAFSFALRHPSSGVALHLNARAAKRAYLPAFSSCSDLSQGCLQPRLNSGAFLFGNHMRRGIGRLRAGGAVAYSINTPPTTVFGSRLLVWHDPSDLAVAWQDSARTTPALLGQTVGSRQNKGTLSYFMQQTIAGSRPILRQDGNSQYYDELDGLDDSFGSSATLDLSAYDKLTICVGVRKESDAASGIVLEFSAALGSNPGTFQMAGPNGAGTATFGFTSKGTVAAVASSVGFAAPIAPVVTSVGDISGDSAILRVNGTQVASTVTDQGTGNFGNFTLFEGRRNNTSLPFGSRMYQRLIIAGLISQAEMTYLEAYVASKMTVS